LPRPYENPRSVLITGASSGIGRALALAYAEPGIRLFLSGRNSERLEEAAAAGRAQGAEVSAQTVDVCARDDLARWIAACHGDAPLDLVIANAGISGGTGGTGDRAGESAEQARRILAVNLDGAMNTALAALDLMRARGRGQIALMASLAAFRGFPGAPAYCASKAALRVWGEALRGEVAAQGIAVNVICPGYVESAMTAVNDFPMPFLMPAEKAAGIIRRGLARNAARIAFPWQLYWSLRTVNALPLAVTDPLLARLPKKS
jgi:short-subunit dehydrogenase